MRIPSDWTYSFRSREVPMVERNVGSYGFFSLRELHFRLEFRIITPLGERFKSYHFPQQWRDPKRKVEHKE